MHYLILAALLTLAPLSPMAYAETGSTSFWSDWRPYAEIKLWEASDAIAVKEFESDWSNGFDPKGGSNTTLQRYRAEAGVENGRWSLGVEARQEASLVTDRETLELVRLYKQRLDPASDATFVAQARFKGWSAKGLRVGYALEGPVIGANSPRIKISTAFYTQPQLRENQVAGSVSYAQPGTYGFDATQSDINSRAQYPFMQYDPSASGASLSVAVDWPLSDSLMLSLKFEDLWSRIKWSNLPHMQRTITSNVSDVDSEGYINYRPALSGQNSQSSRTFSIPRSYDASLSYRSGAWRTTTRVEYWSGLTIPTLSLTRHFGWGNVTASVETRFKTIGFGFERGGFRMAVQSDNLDFGRAKARALHISYRMTMR